MAKDDKDEETNRKMYHWKHDEHNITTATHNSSDDNRGGGRPARLVLLFLPGGFFYDAVLDSAQSSITLKETTALE